MKKPAFRNGNQIMRIGMGHPSNLFDTVCLECPDGFRFGRYDRNFKFKQESYFSADKICFKALGWRISIEVFSGGQRLPYVVSKCRSVSILPGKDGSLIGFHGRQYPGGFRIRNMGGRVDLVNFVPLEDYVVCSLACEMQKYWPFEALKAQAVCIRTYAAYMLNTHRAQGFDLCCGQHCQMYFGQYNMNNRVISAANETSGEFLTYEGQCIKAAYYESNGGTCESALNIWGLDLPCYREGTDPYCAMMAPKLPHYNWAKEYTGEELRNILSGCGFTGCGRIVSLELPRTALGNVHGMRLTDEFGKVYEMYGEPMRIAFSMCSHCFDVRQQEDVFIFEGRAHGHNIGMSQWGAYGMAVQKFDYKDILAFYFPGTEITTFN